jgi:hypothetical protein
MIKLKDSNLHPIFEEILNNFMNKQEQKFPIDKDIIKVENAIGCQGCGMKK